MILVVGSTGQLGGMITQQLLAGGKDVRILVRSGSNYQPLVDAGAHPIMGDLKDRASLDAACAGVDVVITTANAAQRGGADGGADTFETVDRQGNRNLIDAAKAAGVKQFIFVSGLGSSPDSPDPLMSAKAATEAHLRASGIPFTIIGANIFLDVWVGLIIGLPLQTGQPVTLVGSGARKHSFVAIKDVAAFTVAAVDNPNAINQFIPVGGPEPVSWLDIVAAVEKKLGHSLTVNHIKPGEMVPNTPPPVSSLMAATDSYESPLDMAPLAQLYGVKGTTLSEFLGQMFGVPG